jgi:hypothetical protein
MTALVVIQIKHTAKRNHMLTEKEANILFAHLDAQEKRIKELEQETVRLVNELTNTRDSEEQ